MTSTAGGASAVRPEDVFSYAGPPKLTILAPSAVAPTGATLRASINTSGLPITGCHFQYGTSKRYSHTVRCSSGSSPGGVIAVLNGLVPATGYHYQLTAVTASGTSLSADQKFSTPQLPAVVAPLVGLVIQRDARQAGVIGKLLGIQGISGAALGESLLVQCVKACSHKLMLKVRLLNARVMRRKIRLLQALLLSTATRIEIDVSANGKLSRYARYAFAPAGQSLAVRVTVSGCLSASRRVVRCGGRAIDVS